MNRKYICTLLTVVFLFAGSLNCFAAHGEKSEKKAILLVAFGTSVPQAQRSFDLIDAAVKKSFPGVETRWAFTSKTIRAKLAGQGKVVLSPESALAKLMEDGYTHVAVASLHIIAGKEFHELYRNALLFGQMAGGFEQVQVAWPLLSSHEDMERAARAMLKHIPAERKPGDAVLLMGHGTGKHPSDALYLAMHHIFQEIDPNVFLATVDGYPGINDILPKLKEKKIGKVYLIPFMAVAGEHARNDMAGEKPDSWKSILAKSGFACEAMLEGNAEYPEIVDIWVDHLREVFNRF